MKIIKWILLILSIGLFFFAENVMAATYSPMLEVVPATTSAINVYSSGGVPTLTYTVTNKSTELARNLKVNGQYKANTGVVAVTVSTDTCTGQSLAQNASCSFTVSLQGTGSTNTATLSPQVLKAGGIGSQPVASNRVEIIGNSGPGSFTITPSAGSNGSVSPNTAQTVNYGDNSPTFTATPSTGYQISGWTVDGSAYSTCATNTTCQLINVTANHTIAVNFTIQTFTVTASAGSNGSISPNGATSVNYNGSQLFTASPDTGYQVSGWTVDGSAYPACGTSTTCTLSSVTANHTIAVSFILQTFTITPSAGSNGSISPSTAQTVNYNGSQLFTATPNADYAVSGWTVDGAAYASCSTNTTCTLSSVTADHTIAVSFALGAPTITTVSPSSGLTAGGNLVTITGTFLSNASSVTFGGIAATIVSNTSTEIMVQTPAHAGGSVDVVVTTSSGSVTSTNAYTYIATKAYVFNQAGSNISTCTISDSDGTFSACSTTTGGVVFNGPYALIQNKSSTFLYLTDLGTNKIYRCPLTSGSVGSCVDTKTFSGTSLRNAMMNPLNTYIYVAGFSNSVIYYCPVNSDGTLGTCNTTGSGFGGPAGIAINPAGNKIYIANLNANTISLCTIDSGGTLSSCATTGGTFTAVVDLVINSANSLAYVVLNGSGQTVSKCSVDNSTGALSSCSTTGFSDGGSTSYNFQNSTVITINSQNTYAYITNYTGDVVTQCAISSGELINCANTGTGFDGPIGISVGPVFG